MNKTQILMTIEIVQEKRNAFVEAASLDPRGAKRDKPIYVLDALIKALKADLPQEGV
jgi:hypothetical protein